MHDSNDDLLQDATRAWNDVTPQESLTEDRKAFIFNEIRRIGDEAREAPYVPMIVRGWRWALVGAFPVLGIAAVLIAAGDRTPPQTIAMLSAEKVNGQVVFTLANGRTDHVVYRSTDPSSFDQVPAEPLQGNRFSDDTDGGPALVFYRID